MIGKSVDRDEELFNFLTELKEKDFDVSEDSNIVKILEIITNSHVENRNQIKKILDSLSFENRSGNALDELYNFFGIPRIIRNFNEATFKIFNNGPFNILIKSNTIIQIQNKLYRITTDQNISSQETKEFVAYPIEYFIELNNYVIINDFIITLKNVFIDHISEEDKHNYLKENILISDFKVMSDKESDIEYKSRANSLIQTFGYNNITKIKNYVMGIDNVANVKIDREFGRQVITIIPKEIKFLEDILLQANESVDYFCTSPVKIKRPTITVLNVSGVTEQLKKWFGENVNTNVDHLSNIYYYLKEYCESLIFENEKEIGRDTIEFSINKYFVDNDIHFSLDEDKLIIEYSIYTDENYESPVIKNTLNRREKKEIKTDLVILGDVI